MSDMTRDELERFMSFMPEADCLVVEEIGDGLCGVMPADSATGTVMVGMHLITTVDEVEGSGLDLRNPDGTPRVGKEGKAGE